MIDGRPAVARNQLVETNGIDVAGVDPAMRLPGCRVFGRLEPAAESNCESHVAGGSLPYVAQPQPAARDFALTAVGAYDLRENAVVVPDAVAHGRVLQRGEGIQKTCRQTSQAAVAQPRIDFLRRDVFEIVSQFPQGIARLLHQGSVQAGQGIQQGTPRKIFNRKIAHALHVGVRHPALRGQPAQGQFLAHRQRERIIDVARRRRFRILAERSGEAIEQRREHRTGLQCDASAAGKLGINRVHVRGYYRVEIRGHDGRIAQCVI